MGREQPEKFSALYHGGLEVVPPSEAPQVVDDEALPEPRLIRKSSTSKPEAYRAAGYYGDDAEVDRRSQDAHAPEHDPRDDQTHVAQHGRPADSGKESESGRERRYCCGMTRRMTIVAIVVIISIVVVGAVLGGTLGTLLQKKSSSQISQAPLQTMENTGLASVISSADPEHLLTYYQDPQGRIIENSYHSNTWTLSDRTNVNKSIVTTAATAGSPLAAISYTLNGKHYRQIFFVTSTGGIMTTNSSETIPGTQIATSWGAAHAITNDIVAASSIGLAACSSNGLMNGISVFYPSQYDYIQERKYNFSDPVWKDGDYWNGGDTKTGLACATYIDTKDQYINLYMRWTKTGAVKQVYYNFLGNNTGSVGVYNKDGPSSWANQTIAAGSDIAVAGDSSKTEYVYYRREDGMMARGLANPSFDVFDAFDDFDLKPASAGKLAASFIDGGAMVMYQNSTSDSTIMFDNVSRYGAEILQGVVP